MEAVNSCRLLFHLGYILAIRPILVKIFVKFAIRENLAYNI